MRQMNNAMNSLLGNPFGNDMFGGGGGAFPGRPPSMAMMPFNNPAGSMLSPFPFPNMNNFMQNMSQMSNDPNCHSFSSSSVMTMTTGPDGKPQVSLFSLTLFLSLFMLTLCWLSTYWLYITALYCHNVSNIWLH